MEGNSSPKLPLLGSIGRRLSGSSRRGRFSRHNSFKTLRNDFISRLPEKLRSGVDDEAPYDVDFSKTSSLTPGLVTLFKLIFFELCSVLFYQPKKSLTFCCWLCYIRREGIL